MSQNRPPPSLPKADITSKKRKDPPSQPHLRKNEPNKRPKVDYRAKQRDARQISTQTTSVAFKNGELVVDKFVRAREYEIRALEDGMNRSRKGLNQRAFQQVPKDLRRRTASHNVKKMPKRLRDRGKREMLEDNTPTVTARRRKPTRHMRLRQETIKKIRAQGAKRKAEEKARIAEGGDLNKSANGKTDGPAISELSTIKIRAPRIKKTKLAVPPTGKAKFRKRQIHKSWLPTHLFHAKRAVMTAPSQPLWRFSIPLSPTAKSYRPTHRAIQEKGAVAWDVSYMSSIGLEGREASIENVLKGLRVGIVGGQTADHVWGRKGAKWRQGTRVLETFVYEREAPHNLICPATIIWCALGPTRSDIEQAEKQEKKKEKRKVLVRCHPSAFFQLWEEILRLAKVTKPQTSVEDLRFELGSVQVAGPGSTEALLGALWPIKGPETDAEGDHDMVDVDAGEASTQKTWTSLSGLTNASILPRNALLGFNIQDPRLHHPPRTIKPPPFESGNEKLLRLISSWPVDSGKESPAIFDRRARLSASASLPSQKSINRRKALAEPGEYPQPTARDPRIPVMAYTTSTCEGDSEEMRHNAAVWNVLLPWKCVQPVWYSIMYYPLSTGQQPRYGGLDQIRQLRFERCQAWFPADYPGTNAGWLWEVHERQQRYDQWRRRPKSKRMSFEKVDLGGGQKGEVGNGWSCDWERLMTGTPSDGPEGVAIAPDLPTDATDARQQVERPDKSVHPNHVDPNAVAIATQPPNLLQLTSAEARSLLNSADVLTTSSSHKRSMRLMTVRLRLVGRGVPETCARIYRLPSATANSSLRKSWLALLPSDTSGGRNKTQQHALPRLPKDAPTHVVQQRLAASLLRAPKIGEEAYPTCPGEEDLAGFVTTGNFNLREGRGTGIGSLWLERVHDGRQDGGRESRLCIVRGAGDSAGRLARWELV